MAGLLTTWAGRSSSIPANEKQAAKSSPFALLLSQATRLASILFIVVLMILITKGTTALVKSIGTYLKLPWELKGASGVIGRTVEYLNVILYTPTWLIASVALGLVLFGFAMAHLINPNKFSLHAMYRDRLIRAYLGAASRRRDPNPFTGFDDADNIPLHEVWSQEKSSGKLFPIINVALNLVGGSNLAWQERKAASFTMSPLHCGSYASRRSASASIASRTTAPSATPRRID